jgi:hypothetical protein
MRELLFIILPGVGVTLVVQGAWQMIRKRRKRV